MSRNQLRFGLYMISIIVVLSVFAYMGTAKANQYEIELRAAEQRNLNELGEHVDELKINLQKGIYSNSSPMLASLSTELWRSSSSAKDCLSQISTQDVALYNTYKFLSQVGDFTMSLNRKVASGQKITDKEREYLLKLLDYADDLSKSIAELRTGIDNGTISTSQMLSGNIKIEEDTKTASLSSGFSSVEQSLSDYPTLIYDGPFSDHILQKESEMLKDKKVITKEEALKIAAKYCGTDAKNLSFSTEENGVMKCYVYSGKDRTIAITKNGGYLCYMLGSEWASETSLEAKDGIAKAKDYLSSIGYKSMESTYYTVVDGICTINFAYTVNNVICYTDLIKVSISLSNGGIVSVDARGFLINHIDRDFNTPTLTLSQAKAFVSKSLQIESHKLTNVPTQSGGEEFCYEFKCKGVKNDDVLVYINTDTGVEVQILMLIYADGGTLTM